MTMRIAVLTLGLIAAGTAQTQASPSPSSSQAAASSLQGQKAWDFLTASPAVSRREVPTTGSVAQPPHRSVDSSGR